MLRSAIGRIRSRLGRLTGQDTMGVPEWQHSARSNSSSPPSGPSSVVCVTPRLIRFDKQHPAFFQCSLMYTV